MKGVLFVTLFLGFWFLFSEIRLVDHMAELMRKTRWDMDAAARQRALESRRNLLVLQQEHTLLYGLERELDYSGLRLRFPGLTSELWILGSLAAAACLFLFLSMSLGLWAAVIGNGALLAGEFLILRCLRTANLRAVNEHLMKLLDFLGNYSITAGDVAGIFHQVSRYMEEPIKSALDSCYYEAQITGDTALALRSMAEKIEHPKFKELARNMEDQERFGVCLDVAHAFISGSPIEPWFTALKPYIKHVHLNDNDGREDLHLPVGSGSFDWEEFNQWGRSIEKKPSFLIEVRTFEDLQRSVQYMEEHKIFPFI